MINKFDIGVHILASPGILFLASCICFQSLSSQSMGTWTELNVPKEKRLTNIDFIDSVNGCLSTRDSLYVTTTDGGTTWSEYKTIPNCSNVARIKLFNKDTIVALEEGIGVPVPIMLHVTSDGGRTWTERIAPDSLFMLRGRGFSLLTNRSIGFVNRFLVLYESSDLGLSWRSWPLVGKKWPIEVLMFDTNSFFLFGGDGISHGCFLQSDDGGVTWTPRFDQSSLASVNSEFYNNSLGCFQLYYEYEIFQKYNTVLYNRKNGTSKMFADYMGFGALYDSGDYILFNYFQRLFQSATDSTFYIAGTLGSRNEIKIKHFVTTDQKYAWILSDSGRAFKRIDLLTSVDNNRSTTLHCPENTYLLNPYPNPFNNSCKIQFGVNGFSEKVQILIIDLLGRKQRLLFDGELSVASQVIDWDGKDKNSIGSPSGMYFVVLQSSSRKMVKPILLVK